MPGWSWRRLAGMRPAVLGLGLVLCACRAPSRRFAFEHPAMGTTFRIVLYDRDEGHAGRAAEAAFQRVDALEDVLSDYRDSSELSRLGRASDEGAPTTAIPVSAELWDVLTAADGIARDSDGAFDITVGPLVGMWRRAFRQEQRPTDARIEEALAAVGHGKIERIDGQRVRLLARGMRLDVGGIGKGYALDRALAELGGHGIDRALLDGGGDLLAGAPPPGERGWHVRIVGLEAGEAECLELAHAALATSGDLERFALIDGVRVSHVIDPRSGEAVSERRLVSVLAPSATEADAWATALSVLGEEGLGALEEGRARAARILVRREGAQHDEVFRGSAFPVGLSCGHPRDPSDP
jgi:thiamine biosynthesis lipoprotein